MKFVYSTMYKIISYNFLLNLYEMRPTMIYS